ncbi:NCS2 family permease [Halioxenophilus sp. WMMB6]|uniref:NCS2 family permease n=1 Tax=Halioxenophilus sp. WMMB6 TaxID=3073815 RepID=UPI00295E5B2F|nr:NCS2 family permease [Halioxenophilus sp. WMMB6]
MDQFFKISQRGSSLRQEFIAALTTFATMSYVLAVHPSVLADAGMDRATMITCTALAAGIFSILMGVMANLPIAQAPGMGSNALFAYTIILVMGVPWQAALGLTFWSGVIFFLMTVTGVRRLLLEAFPNDLKTALTVGIGLFLMFIGLKNAGIVVAAPAPVLIAVGDLKNPAVLLAAIGVPAMVLLAHKKVPGGILMVIAAITAIGWFIPNSSGGTLTAVPDAIVSKPVSSTSLFMAFDLGYLWKNFAFAFPVLLSLVFIDLFSSLVAIRAMCIRAGISEGANNSKPIYRALAADAIATIGASAIGTSTTNVYGESAAGIESGGRTGLTAIFVGLFFLLALFVNPLLMIIPAHATAPALILIGILMFTEVRHIQFDNLALAGPAILCMILMMVTSISDGLALGLISYVIIRVLSGQVFKVSPMSWLLAASFGLYYLLI